MRLESKSMVDDAPRWEEPSDDGPRWEEPSDDWGRCRRHLSISQPPYSVCAMCLRDRLLLLCPDCANKRPCSCPSLPSTSASSTCSSFSSTNGSARGTNGSLVGGSDKISNLIACEPAFPRSKSVGFPLMRSGSVGMGMGMGIGIELERSRSVATGVTGRRKKRWKWAAIWLFKGCSEKGEEKGKESKWWYFPSPIRIFTHRKSTSRGTTIY